MPIDFRVKRRIAYMRRNRCGVLLAALCLFILINPFVAGSFGAVFLALGMVTILVLAMWALRARRRTLLALGLLALFTVNAVAVDRLGAHWLRPATLAITGVFIGAVTAGLLYYVLDWRPITTDKVFGAVAAYVLIAFTFASLFGLLQQVQPHAFHASPVHAPDEHLDWPTMMYFSFTVLTSTGFAKWFC
jgi:MFS family permease